MLKKLMSFCLYSLMAFGFGLVLGLAGWVGWLRAMEYKPAAPLYHGISIVSHFDRSDDMETECLNFWVMETQTRFPDAVILGGHGGQLPKMGWCMQEEDDHSIVPMEIEIGLVEAQYPGRTIVILSCDEAGVQLHGHPNVYYAEHNVWMVPFRFMPDLAAKNPGMQLPSLQDEPTVGSIWEFVNAK